MKKTFIVLTIIAVFAVFFTLVGQNIKLPVMSQTADMPKSQTQLAPDFVFTDGMGKDHRLRDFRGKTVIVNFWGTWCQVCITEFPAMMRFMKQQSDDIVLIALASDDNMELVDRFIKKLPFDVRPSSSVYIGLDTKRAITRDLYGTTLYPETFFIAPDGRIIKKIAGEVPWADVDITHLDADISPK